LDEEGSIWFHPYEVLDKCECHLHQSIIKEVLVQWKDKKPQDAIGESTTIL